MTERPFAVIVTLPARSFTEVKGQLPACLAAGADVAEIRFDRWTDEGWKAIPQLFPSALPLLATYRSRTEGGDGADAEEDRRPRLEILDRLPFRYLDLERRRDAQMIERLLARKEAPRPVLSTHLGPSWTLSEVQQALEVPAGDAPLIKVVAPATTSALYAQLRSLLPFDTDGPPRALFTTGGSGPILRALSRRLGLAAVYAAPPTDDQPTASLSAVEPSQIPVDAFRTFLGADRLGRVFALLGHPVAHSLSPRMHNGWYAIQKRAALFVPIDIDPTEDFGRVVDDLGRDGFEGFNVTHPWKVEALVHASNANPQARRAGCANTLTREPSGWSADNFDVSAIVRRCQELRNQGVWTGDDILVLGGGGAARAALVATEVLGARARVLTRNPARASELARDLGAEIAGGDRKPASLVLHATTTGMSGNPIPLELDWTSHLRPDTYVLDMVYHPVRPEIREAAEARGAQYEDGSRLLVYQAMECHRRWWGEPPGDALESWALEEVLCVA